MADEMIVVSAEEARGGLQDIGGVVRILADELREDARERSNLPIKITDDDVAKRNARSEEEVSCAFCGVPVVPGNERVVRCRSCKAVYHPECWQKNAENTPRGCSTLGCKYSRPR